MEKETNKFTSLPLELLLEIISVNNNSQASQIHQFSILSRTCKTLYSIFNSSFDLAAFSFGEQMYQCPEKDASAYNSLRYYQDKVHIARIIERNLIKGTFSFLIDFVKDIITRPEISYDEVTQKKQFKTPNSYLSLSSKFSLIFKFLYNSS